MEDGSFTFTPQNNNVISYSTDNGETWTAGNSVNVTTGDKVLWKGEMTPNDSGIGTFSSSGEFDAKGNVMSLLYGDNFKGQTTLEQIAVFCNLFYDINEEKTCGIVNAKDMSLPATTLTSYCYVNMFYNCTSLVTAPELPATTLPSYCYSYMFYNCTSLVTAPELPATTLVGGCYGYMFSGCTSLVTAPELPATTLVDSCYSNMFKDCSSLNYIKAMFTTTPSGSSPNYYTSDWVSNVAATGTFVKNSAAQWNVTGVEGVPSGWTVQTASE